MITVTDSPDPSDREAILRPLVAYNDSKIEESNSSSWLRIYAQRDLRGIMADGGWDSVQSVIRYLHVAPGESADAVDRLPIVQNPCSFGDGTGKVLGQKRKSR
jgi:hypothetical protein